MIEKKKLLGRKDLGKSQIQSIAKIFATQISKGDLILLEGEVGVGKTFFSRALINAKFVIDNLATEEVPSPTFSLVQVYDFKNLSIFHLDFYRLKDQQDLIELGVPDIFEDNVTLLEWPNLIDRALLQRFIIFNISQNKNLLELRDIKVTFFGNGWEKIYKSNLLKKFFPRDF